MSIDFTRNYFELFDLPQKFRLDILRMSEVWRNIQNQIHPDKHVNGSQYEKRLAMQWATYVNEGLVTLRDPVSRARYLLSLHGFDTHEETDTRMPADFLMEQMSWHEAVYDAFHNKNINMLNELFNQLREVIAAGESKLGQLIDDEGNYSAAVTEVRKLCFLQSFSQDITQSIERLEQ
ncbi:MAG: Fe-S protein assembly co-chaperone HscB [Pseudomonadota bacterium]|nr:Fe-S protein assembly co-chaperone HscB [Pseudomonadota bacterium]